MGKTIVEQVNRREKLEFKAFIMAVAGIILRLAVAQILTTVLILLTRTNALNVLFYGYTAILVFRFLQQVLASDRYALEGNHLRLQRRLGDIRISELVIPLAGVVAIREYVAAERLSVTYARVRRFHLQTTIPRRVRIGSFLACVSARLARRVTGSMAGQPVGLVIAYSERNRIHACEFEPNAEMMAALSELLPGRIGVDDRLSRPPLKTFMARSLARAFPEWYPHVEPLVTQEDEAWAEERRQARMAEKQERRARTEKRQEDEARRRQYERNQAERRKAAKAKRDQKKKARKYRDEDILPEDVFETETPRMMEIPEHPEIVEVEYNPDKATGGRRRRNGSRRENR